VPNTWYAVALQVSRTTLIQQISYSYTILVRYSHKKCSCK
jgi:hypothetical protein